MRGVIVPVRVVSEANQREHWAKRFKRKNQQQMAVLLKLASCIESKPSLPCGVMLVRIAPHMLDTDNLVGSFKHVRDCVARWLGTDDGPKAPVSWHYDQRKGRPKEYAVEIGFMTR